MKKVLFFIATILIMQVSVNAFDVTSYAMGSMMRPSSNRSGCEHTGPMHIDTNRIEFTCKDKPNAKVLVFTYHECGAAWHGTLWYALKNGRLYYQRDHIFLKSDPAKMSIEELRKAL